MIGIRRLQRFATVFVSISLVVSLATSAHAAPGDVDPSFGFAGKVVVNFPQGSSEILSLAHQPDGKLVAVGKAHETAGAPSRFLITRHDSNGALDTTFGAGGKVITDFPQGASSAHAVALQSDGKIVVAGKAGDFFAVARYNSDGSLDYSFGTAGLVSLRFQTDHLAEYTVALASSIAIQSDGKIVIAGDSFVRNPYTPGYVLDCNVAVARFNTDGTLDTTFGTGGIVLSDFGSFDRADALVIQPDGKILVAGDSNSTGSGPYSAFLFRHNSDGTADETFGVSGLAAAITGSFDVAAMALQPDGKIVLGGTFLSAVPANADFALARYNGDGTIDNGFGAAGLAVHDFSWTGTPTGRENIAATLAIQPDGKILLGGYSASTFALSRYTGAGIPDLTFGSNGVALTQVSSLGSVTYSFPVAASSSFGVSFINLSGNPNLPPGFFFCATPPCGVPLSLFLIEQAFALGIQSDGKIIAGGVLDKQAVLVRFHSISSPKIMVATTGDGLGAIWSPDGALSCGTRCSASYDASSTVLLGWSAAVGSYFAGWTGCALLPGGGCALALNGDSTVTARFNLELPIADESATLPASAVGLNYLVQVALPGLSQPIASKVVSGSVPSGLALSGRMLAGAPRKAGTFRFTVEFNDAAGARVRKRLSLTVHQSLSVNTRSLKSGRLGRSYSASLQARGGSSPYTWSMIAGALPAGITFDAAAGRIAGTPTAAGAYPLTFRVSDGLGQQSEKSFTLKIN